MSVDKFGRIYRRAGGAGARGPPGPGFVLTTGGHFDLGKKRLKRALDPVDLDDAATKKYVDVKNLDTLKRQQINIAKIHAALKKSISDANGATNTNVKTNLATYKEEVGVSLKTTGESVDALAVKVGILVEKTATLADLIKRVDELKDSNDVLYTELDKILTIFNGATQAIKGGGKSLDIISKAIAELGGDSFTAIAAALKSKHEQN